MLYRLVIFLISFKVVSFFRKMAWYIGGERIGFFIERVFVYIFVVREINNFLVGTFMLDGFRRIWLYWVYV